MADERERWALILGASSGFGEATSLALAAAGYNIFGVHLDRRQGMVRVESIKEQIAASGREVVFFNVNAADDEQRARVIAEMRSTFEARAANHPYVRVMLHSLAFGTLRAFLAEDPTDAISHKNMDMTLDVMANSLVYWTQDAWHAGLFGEGTKIYAMTSEGSTRVIRTYGAVSAAKAALESHCRQLAMEFAKLHTGITVNAVRAGVTMTPALMQIPERDALIAHGEGNPMGRMTTVDDVAQAIVSLSGEGTHWITGNVIGIDGGELISG